MEKAAASIPSLLNHPVGAEEIIQIYRIVLGRLPENEAVIDDHLRSGGTIAEFIEKAVNSPEVQSSHQGVQTDAVAPTLARRIDVDATPEQLEYLMVHAREVWTEYGEKDPYWSVLAAEAYRRDALDADVEKTFYDTGTADAGFLHAIVNRNGLDLPSEGRVLDFGCGVGRVGEHLAMMFAEYEGVDISEAHIALARQRFASVGFAAASFRSLADFLHDSNRYHCVYSLLVLQHTPPPVMLMLVERLLGCIRPGGIGLLQIPCATSEYEFDLSAYLDGLDTRKQMEMHALPHYAVLDAIEGGGCQLVEAVDDGRYVPCAKSFSFLVQRR